MLIRDLAIRVLIERSLVVVVAIVVPVVVLVLVPLMVVGDLALVAVPVAFMVHLAIMVRLHPVRAAVRRTSPVSVVPLIVTAHRVPIARNPGIAFPRTAWLSPFYAQRRRRADSHSDGQLGEDGTRRQQHQDT